MIYVDFESFTEKIDTQPKYPSNSYISQYQKHPPSGFTYYIAYRDGFYKPPITYTEPDIADVYCKHMHDETIDIYNKYFKKIVPMKMTGDPRRLCNLQKHRCVSHLQE